jgi:type II secretory pathway pseudopilin PulG
MNSRRRNKNEHGVALVTTVIVVAMLAVVAVALMQSTTTDRLSSRTSANYFKAQLAAQAGLAMASEVLAGQTDNDTFIVVGNQSGQLFVGNGVAGGTTFSYVPAFSAVTLVGQEPPAVTTAGVPDLPAGGVILTNELWGGLVTTSPPVSWVYLLDANGQTNARFAFWTEDLGGRLDLSVVGSTGAAARRPSGTNAEEIALWSVFDPSADSGSGDAAAGELISGRSSLVTPATARLVSQSVTTAMLPELAARLRHEQEEVAAVPFGFGYADAGSAKTDLTSASVQTISGAISRNLPNFGARGGGMTGPNYVNNIAANIVDFVDADNASASGAGYRGVEVLPYVNERATSYRQAGSPRQVGQRWEVDIETIEFLEFWNLHDVATQPASLAVGYKNTQPIIFGTEQSLAVDTNFTVAVPAIPPNGYHVVQLPTLTNVVSVNSTLPPAGSPRLKGDSENVRYQVSSEGSVFDQGLGCNISDVSVRTDSPYFSATYPALGGKSPIVGQAAESFLSTHGDPRGAFFMLLPQHQVNYERNSSFGGRNRQTGNLGRPNSEVVIDRWPDGGHNDTAGAAPASAVTPPRLGTFVSNAQMAPARANKTPGSLRSVTELSHIFDPMQWSEQAAQRVVVTRPGPALDGNWTNVTQSAVASTNFSGGTTLRIGRPELNRFTNDGTRAAQLLDLFTAGPALGPVPAGRINVNTAGTNALRALAAGVYHTNDPLLAGGTGAGSSFVVPAAAVNEFVTAVVNSRNLRPFYSASQLAGLSTGSGGWPGGAVFGNKTLAGITAGNDAASEEWFARVYPLATVRSRNFLVHVVAQTFFPGKTDKRISEYRACYHLYAEPQRGAGGLTTNSVPRIVTSWTL